MRKIKSFDAELLHWGKRNWGRERKIGREKKD
jgi:hypothetical protein